MKSSREVSSLLKLAAPVVLAHLANMAMQIVDTMFVGRLGAAPLGGISIANAVYSTLMVFGIGVLIGMDFLVSHAFGAGRIKDCNRTLIQALYLSVMYSVPCMLVMYFGANAATAFGVTPLVAEQAAQYLEVVSWSLLPFLLFNSFRSYLQGMGIAAPIMVIMVVANAVNALGNWIFIYGNWGMPALGVAGAGLTTVVGRVFMLVALVLYTIRRDRRRGTGLLETPLRYSGAYIRRMIGLGLPAALQLVLEVGVFATVTMLAGRLGAVPLAAHQVVLQIASVTFMVPLGLSSAAAVRVGQALGQGHRHRAARIGWLSLGVAALFGMFSGLVLYASASLLLMAFTKDLAVISIGASLMLVAAFFQLFDGIQVVAAGVLRGVGNTRASMLANFMGHWTLGLPVGAYLCFSLNWGAHGLWIGLCIGLTVVALLLLYVWSRLSKEI